MSPTTNSTVALTKDQAAVLSFVLENVEAREEVQLFSFHLSGEPGSPFYAAVLGIGVDEVGREIRVVVSLPVQSQGVFLAVTARMGREVARLLANLEDYERETARTLRPLESVVTDGPGDIKALFLLRTASHSALVGIPDDAEINFRKRSFSLVIGLSEAEYRCKLNCDVNALLDSLQKSNRSMLVFE